MSQKHTPTPSKIGQKCMFFEQEKMSPTINLGGGKKEIQFLKLPTIKTIS